MGETGQADGLQSRTGGPAAGGGNPGPALDLVRRYALATHGGVSIEYSIIAVLVAIAGVAALMTIGPFVMQSFTDAAVPL